MAQISTTADLTALVDAELRDVFDSRDMDFYRMMSYHLGWEGAPGQPEDKISGVRNHGVACLLASNATGGDIEQALPAAAAVELVNSFTEIHGDVQGGRPQRGTRDSVWWIWGPAQAINAGDGMYALARLALFRLKDRGVPAEVTFRAVQLMDMASLDLCEGRFQDLEAQERIDVSVDAYLEMAASRTGALYACAMKLGALIARADEGVLQAFEDCGSKLGLGLQVRLDISELWGDNEGVAPVSDEVLNKKKLLPVVYALEKADVSGKRRLGEVYFKRVLEPDDVASVRRMLEEMGARQYCEGLVRQYRDEAVAAIRGTDVAADGSTAVKRFVDSLLAT